jgi:hypothetical protein
MFENRLLRRIFGPKKRKWREVGHATRMGDNKKYIQYFGWESVRNKVTLKILAEMRGFH